MKKLLLFGLVAFLLISLSGFAYADFTTNNQAWYTLNTNLTYGVLDQSPNGNDATNNGATYDATENAFDFDGTDDYVRALGINAVDTGVFTYNIWFKSGESIPVSVDKRLIHEGNTGNDDVISGIYLENSNSNINSLLRDDTKTNLASLQGTTTLSSNTWYMATLTSDGTTIKLYLNGVEEDSVDQTLTGFTTNVVSIGALERTSVVHFFNGKINSPGIYNTSLSPTEVADL